MTSTHPRVGMAVLVGVRVKAKVWALARRDAHYFGLGRIQSCLYRIISVSSSDYVVYRIVSVLSGFGRYYIGFIANYSAPRMRSKLTRSHFDVIASVPLSTGVLCGYRTMHSHFSAIHGFLLVWSCFKFWSTIPLHGRGRIIRSAVYRVTGHFITL